MQALLFYLIFVKSQGPFTENSYIFCKGCLSFPDFLPPHPSFFPCILSHLCYTTIRQVSTPCPSAARGVRSALAVL